MQASNHNSKEQSKPLLPLSSIPAYWAESIKQSTLEQLSLSEVIEAIKCDPETRKRVEHIRSISDKTERTKEKNRILPYFSLSRFKNNSRSVEDFISTQYFILDVDDLKGKGPALRKKLQNDPEPFIIFTSPSGDGLKIVYEFREPITDAQFYSKLYAYYCNLFSKRYGIKTDPATKDASRACFFSSDPDIYVNEQRRQIEAVLPPGDVEKPIWKTNKIAEALKQAMRASVDPCDTQTECNRAARNKYPFHHFSKNNLPSNAPPIPVLLHPRLYHIAGNKVLYPESVSGLLHPDQ